MTPDRCPQCGAALPAGASWCSLCFHHLEPEPERVDPLTAPLEDVLTSTPPADPVLDPHPAPTEPAPAGTVPPTSAYQLIAGSPGVPTDHPATAVPAAVPVPVTAACGTGGSTSPAAGAVAVAERPAGWPCVGCGATVSLDLMACDRCGAAFLPSSPAMMLPMVGDPRSLSGGAKALVMSVGTLAVTAVVFIVFLLLGAIV